VTVSTDVFIFRIGHLGDTLVALPAIHRIAQLHRGARLWLITNAPAHAGMVTAWDVLQHTGLFAGVIFYDAKSKRALVRLALRCRRATRAVLYHLSPPRDASRIRRDRWYFRVLCGFPAIEGLSDPVPLVSRDDRGQLLVLPRESDRLLQSIDPTGSVPPAPYLEPPIEAVRKVDGWLGPLRGRRLVALGPGSKMPAKQWFLERYQSLCRRMVEQHPDLTLVIFGGPEDRAAASSILQTVGADRAVVLAGVTDIIESAEAMKRCSLYVGNDTGTMHLAATMGLPCIAIFTSRENRDTWAPLGQANVILRRELPCSGCMLERCERERMRCLDLISVDDVWEALAPRLAAAAPADTVLPSPD
jgi:heptosyltransferase-3